MRKKNVLIIAALAIALAASFTLSQAGPVSAQEVPPVGVVVAYVPGQSISIVDQSGVQHDYLLSASLKILPPGRANSLMVGSFVTIIAPASNGLDKQTAVGIVIHPGIPNGWTLPSLSATPVTTETAIGTFTASPTGTQLATGTATETATGTPFATGTATATETPTAIGAFTETPTATPTPVAGGTAASADSLIEWLRSLFRQLLSRQ